MAITQLGSVTTDFDNATPTVLTTSRTQPSGTDAALVITVATEGNVVHSSVTFDGVALALELNSIGSGRRVSIWSLAAPNVVTANIVVTLASAADVGMIASSWEGVNQITPFSGSAANSGNSATPSVVVPSAVGELVIDAFVHDNNGNNPIVGAGQTELADVNVIGDFRTASSFEDGAAPNVTMDWSGMGIGQWASVGASLQPAVVAPVVGADHQMIL